MPLKITQGYIDRSGEKSRSQFFVAEGAGDDYTQSFVDANDVQGGIAVITLCNFTDMTGSKLITVDTPVIPSSVNAQREIALWIQYVDTVTGDYGSMTIPGPDLTLVSQANTDEVDIAANVTMAAFVVILEANLVSEAGNAIEVTRARIIGRRS